MLPHQRAPVDCTEYMYYFDFLQMKIVVNDYLFATVTPGFNPDPYLSANSCNGGDPGTFKGDRQARS